MVLPDSISTLASLVILSFLVTMYLFVKLRFQVVELKIQVSINDRLLEKAAHDIADMGFQLLNLTNNISGYNPGYVYVLKSDSGHYKIGRTSDPDDRLKTFTVKLPMEVKYLMLISTFNMSQLEAMFHRRFDHKRINGEWFDLSHNDLLFLNVFPGNKLQKESMEDVDPIP